MRRAKRARQRLAILGVGATCLAVILGTSQVQPTLAMYLDDAQFASQFLVAIPPPPPPGTSVVTAFMNGNSQAIAIKNGNVQWFDGLDKWTALDDSKVPAGKAASCGDGFLVSDDTNFAFILTNPAQGSWNIVDSPLGRGTDRKIDGLTGTHQCIAKVGTQLYHSSDPRNSWESATPTETTPFYSIEAFGEGAPGTVVAFDGEKYWMTVNYGQTWQPVTGIDPEPTGSTTVPVIIESELIVVGGAWYQRVGASGNPVYQKLADPSWKNVIAGVTAGGSTEDPSDFMVTNGTEWQRITIASGRVTVAHMPEPEWD